MLATDLKRCRTRLSDVLDSQDVWLIVSEIGETTRKVQKSITMAFTVMQRHGDPIVRPVRSEDEELRTSLTAREILGSLRRDILKLVPENLEGISRANLESLCTTTRRRLNVFLLNLDGATLRLSDRCQNQSVECAFALGTRAPR